MKSNKVSTLARYKGILLSVALFLLLDASVLILNFYVSFEISEDASGINLAGRQRMLSQRMTKTLLDVDYSAADSSAMSKALDELQLTRGLFSETLMAFDIGGTVKGAGGQLVDLQAVTSGKARSSIEQAKQLWQPFDTMLVGLINSVGDGVVDLQLLNKTIDYARVNNLALLKLMNDLTVELEQVASSKASRLRWIQTVGISLAIINFLIILFHFLRQLRESDAEINAARRETAEILETVNEGLFLLDKDFVIGNQYSKALEDMLGSRTIAGAKFSDIITDIISPKDLEAAHGFVGLLFKPKVKEKLIQDLNPLNEVQVSLRNSEGDYVTRYLSFNFSRVFSGDDIVHVLVSVIDKTDKVELANRLEHEQVQNDLQLEMLTSILHANTDLLAGFIASAYKSFEVINEQLKKPSKTTKALREKLFDIYREVHRFKGESSALNLHSFTATAHELEESLENLKQMEKLNGNDFLILTMGLDKLISQTQFIDHLAVKLSAFSHQDAAPANAPISDLSAYFFQFANDIAARQAKTVTVFCSGLDVAGVDEHEREFITAVGSQLLRNAIVHGIEPPSQRELAEKTPSGRVELRLSRNAHGDRELVVEDDGEGINYQHIRDHVIASGEYSISEIEGWDNKKLLSTIFQQGFSTSDAVSEDAGRGMGMDIVADYVRQRGGKIQVSTRRGGFTRFKISFPVSLGLRKAA